MEKLKIRLGFYKDDGFNKLFTFVRKAKEIGAIKTWRCKVNFWEKYYRDISITITTHNKFCPCDKKLSKLLRNAADKIYRERPFWGTETTWSIFWKIKRNWEKLRFKSFEIRYILKGEEGDYYSYFSLNINTGSYSDNLIMTPELLKIDGDYYSDALCRLYLREYAKTADMSYEVQTGHIFLGENVFNQEKADEIYKAEAEIRKEQIKYFEEIRKKDWKERSLRRTKNE